jgi:WD40 repeat protein
MIFYSSVSVSSDCNTVASGHQDGGLRMWSMHTKDKIHAIPKLHLSQITCTLFDPRRNYLILTASRDNTISLIDSRTYEQLQVSSVTRSKLTLFCLGSSLPGILSHRRLVTGLTIALLYQCSLSDLLIGCILTRRLLCRCWRRQWVVICLECPLR